MKAKLNVNQKINYRSWFNKCEDDNFFLRAQRSYQSFLYHTSCLFSTQRPYTNVYSASNSKHRDALFNELPIKVKNKLNKRQSL